MRIDLISNALLQAAPRFDYFDLARIMTTQNSVQVVAAIKLNWRELVSWREGVIPFSYSPVK